MDEFSENFRKGRGVISDPNKFIAIFFALETVILVMNFRKNFKKGRGVISDLKNFIANLVPAQPVYGKNRNEFFRKRGGGVQRPFGNFPEIHPFWHRQASLTSLTCTRVQRPKATKTLFDANFRLSLIKPLTWLWSHCALVYLTGYGIPCNQWYHAHAMPQDSLLRILRGVPAPHTLPVICSVCERQWGSPLPATQFLLIRLHTTVWTRPVTQSTIIS